MARGTKTQSSSVNDSATASKDLWQWPTSNLAGQALSYLVDSWQRSLLFWDVMRRRGNICIEHEKAGQPPVLVFDYETVMDGRSLDEPANYALVRIVPPSEHPTDPAQPP